MVTTTAQNFARLYIESDLQSPEALQWASSHVAALCRRCPGKTEPNDDSAGVVRLESGSIVLVVADGVGGCPFGHKASAIAVRSIVEQIRGNTGDLRPAIIDGIERANQDIIDLGVGAATTVAVVEIQDNVARAYQVGDSTTLVIGQRGALKWKSIAHSPVGYALESGLLDENDAMRHDERHVVSNLVGTKTMHIEIGPLLTLAPRDTVIVASDGLFDNLQLAEVIHSGRAGKVPDRLTAMAELAAKRMAGDDTTQPGKPDDLTVLIYSRHG